MRTGLILVAIVFATGVTAAVVADALRAGPSPRAVPPVPPTATAPIGPPSGRQSVPAPIDRLEVRIRESAPPQYSLYVQAGLPSGCAQRDRHEVSRSGDVITVRVLNSMPTGNPMCTMIYGTYELSIDLGPDIKRGVTYTVRVNDQTTTFTGQ